MTIEEATRRRDFTVNAILKDPLTEEILDPFGGRERSRARNPARGFAQNISGRQSARASRCAIRRSV